MRLGLTCLDVGVQSVDRSTAMALPPPASSRAFVMRASSGHSSPPASAVGAPQNHSDFSESLIGRGIITPVPREKKTLRAHQHAQRFNS